MQSEIPIPRVATLSGVSRDSSLCAARCSGNRREPDLGSSCQYRHHHADRRGLIPRRKTMKRCWMLCLVFAVMGLSPRVNGAPIDELVKGAKQEGSFEFYAPS